MKKILSVFTAVLLFAAILCAPALAVVEQSAEYYVADYSNVLTPTTMELIINYNGALEYQCLGAQVVVVTVDYLDGMFTDEYAYQLFNDWGVGNANGNTANNGMLLLLAIEEGKSWLATGNGLNSILSQSTIDSWVDTFYDDYFDRGDFDGAVNFMFMEILAWYDGYYGTEVIASNPDYQPEDIPMQTYPVNRQPEPEYNYTPGYTPERNTIWGFGSAIMRLASIFVIVVVVIFIALAASRPRRRGYYDSYRSGSVFPFFFFGNSWHRRRGPGAPPPPRSHRPPRPGGRRDDDDHRPPRGGGGFGGFGGGSGGGGGGFGGGGGGFGGGSGGGGGGFGGGSGGGGGGFGGGGGGGRR